MQCYICLASNTSTEPYKTNWGRELWMKSNRFVSKRMNPHTQPWKRSLYWTYWTRPCTAPGQMSVLSGQASDDTQQSLKPLPVCPHRRFQLKQLNSGDCSRFNWIITEMAAGCDDNRACCHCPCPPQEKEKTPLCVDTVEGLRHTVHQSHPSEQLGFTHPETDHGHGAEVTHNNRERKIIINIWSEVVQDGIELITVPMLLHWQWAEGPCCIY